MSDCCAGKEEDLNLLYKNHRRVLWSVLIINFLMFFIEFISGFLSNSLALVADSLDMLGDAVTYGASIAVIGKSLSKKSQIAKLKASIMLIFGMIVSGRCIYKAFFPEVPEFDIMLGVGILALITNLICLYLLSSHKEDDINMKSVWICSRNDIIANTSVLLAAGVVFFTNSWIPDLAVGIGLAILFTRSALKIFKEANIPK